jgi:hypothetical protein
MEMFNKSLTFQEVYHTSNGDFEADETYIEAK